MKLSKAIEILKDPDGTMKGHLSPSFHEAIQLLIEAGKRLNKHSPYPHEYLGGPLPGETES